ncbi:hypothetical protein GOBAR_DD33968 [Gossypium barbadense]|nr:hypothetical protein GOBAR_DD33968 [Gossypium barbadense]
MDAKRGGKASWVWSSIVAGKDFLKDSLLWQITNGENVDLWHDKWVWSIQGHKLQHPGAVDFDLPQKVAEIINKETGEWDLTSVENWLNEEEKNAILKIPIGDQEEDDRLVWPYNSAGEYTARSGCKQLRKMQHSVSVQARSRPSTSQQVSRGTWNLIRNLKLPSKIKILVWKVCSKAALQISMCGEGLVSEALYVISDIYIQSVISRIFEICEGLAQSKGESKAKECNEGNINLWRKPDYGWIKINVDGASDMHSHNAGIGVIVRVAGAEYVVNHKYDRVILEIDSLV